MGIAVSSSVSDKELVARFGEEYRLAKTKIMRDIERKICGCDYGGTSWMTRQEARQAGQLLQLEPGKRLLEVGAGSGWPGLYLAGTTGCDAILVDLPFEGIKIAAERVASEGLAGTCWLAVADGTALPLKSGCFDAVIHSDVLCCLREKFLVLKECRRVLGAGGKMVFTVISITANLSPADYARAAASGPPCVESPASYRALLGQAGWQITGHSDLTARYRDCVQRMLHEEETHADELRSLLGGAEYSEKVARRRGTLGAIDAGLLQREMFSAA